MSDERPDVIGSLPSRRPQRRSPKRGPAASDDVGVSAETPGNGRPAATPPAATKRSATAKPPAATKRSATAKPPATTKRSAAATPPAATKRSATTKPPAATKRSATTKRTADAVPRTAVPPKGKPAARKPPVNVRTRTRTAPAPAQPDADAFTAAAGTPGAPGSDRTATSPRRPPTDPPLEGVPGAGGAIQTVVQAAGELTELGLRAGARALRGVVSRLPRP